MVYYEKYNKDKVKFYDSLIEWLNVMRG